MTNQKALKSRSFSRRMQSTLRVDARRMLHTPLFYVMVGIALVMPVLILVMTTMAGGMTVTDPNTGAETAMAAFTSAWQIIASPSGGMSMGMDMTSMCNINLIYFMAGVFVCLFTAEDFRSGYAKNLFTVRARKTDYVASKTVIGFLAGAVMLAAFFFGSILGGKLAGLSFALEGANALNVAFCMLAKIALMAVFVAIFLMAAVLSKQKSWMSILISLFAGMLLFMMIPMMTPLDAGAMHVLLCLAGGALFALGLGAGSNLILKRISLA